MSNKEIEEFVELLYPYFLKKLKEDGSYKTSIKSKNATVVSISKDENGSTLNQTITVKFPYDTTSFEVINKTGEELKTDDTVCLFYWIDLKNAVAQYKVS